MKILFYQKKINFEQYNYFYHKKIHIENKNKNKAYFLSLGYKNRFQLNHFE